MSGSWAGICPLCCGSGISFLLRCDRAGAHSTPSGERSCCLAYRRSIYSEAAMDFRARLLRTLHAVAPILEQPGVLVAGSEVTNLLEPYPRKRISSK